MNVDKMCAYCGCESDEKEEVYSHDVGQYEEWCGVCIIKHAQWVEHEWQSTEKPFNIEELRT
jgi:hypothetical protein